MSGRRRFDAAWNTADAGGDYDLDVFSTNGFVRTFKGNVRKAGTAELSVQVGYDIKSGAVRAQFRNAGKAPVEVRIVANEYRNDGPWTVPVVAEETAEWS